MTEEAIWLTSQGHWAGAYPGREGGGLLDRRQTFHDDLETLCNHAPHLLFSVVIGVDKRPLDVQVQLLPRNAPGREANRMDWTWKMEGVGLGHVGGRT